jgi:hypothetical protein
MSGGKKNIIFEKIENIYHCLGLGAQGPWLSLALCLGLAQPIFAHMAALQNCWPCRIAGSAAPPGECPPQLGGSI